MGTEGLTEIFVAHRRRLEAMARGFVGNREDAADVVSDAFVAFLERGPRDADEAGAWLYVVTRNRARNRVRDRVRAAQRPRLLAEPLYDAPPVDDRVTALLASASESLPARDARALEFRFRHGLSYAEIAAALGLSLTATRVLLHRATRRLREQTVSLLADHHGASHSCRTEMLRDALKGRVRHHEGCASCSAVAEEVYALAARGAFVLPVPFRDRLIDNTFNRWLVQRGPGRIATPSPRVAETLAALVVSGALALGGPNATPLPSAAAPPPPTASAPRAITPLDGSAIALGDTAALEPVEQLVPALDSVEDFLPGSTRGVVAFEDRGGDASTVTADVFEFPRLLGVPLYAPDPIRATGPASGDVRTLHVGTTTDGNRATGLYFRVGLAGVPDGRAAYNVSFAVGDAPCSWSSWINPDFDYGAQTESAADDRFLGTFDTSLSESCSPQTSEQEVAGDGGFTHGMIDYAPYAYDLGSSFAESFSGGFERGQKNARSPYPAVVSGRGVALQIPFDALPPRLRARIDRAEVLREIVVLAGVDLEQDELPDSGQLDYRIERGA